MAYLQSNFETESEHTAEQATAHKVALAQFCSCLVSNVFETKYLIELFLQFYMVCIA